MILPATLQFPQIDPFIFRWGRVGLSWYAFMYLLGFTFAYFILRYRYRHGTFKLHHAEDVSLLVTYCFYGLILGARIGYILFYNLHYFIEHPWEMPAIWHGGMSFHGGLIGMLLAMWIFSKRCNVSFFHVADNVGLCAPVGLGFGRLGNFINGELYGRVTQTPWGMIFPNGGELPRHPSQLYESFFEGPVLFLFLYWLIRTQKREGVVSCFLLIGYGALRFFVEFFREPDPQLGTFLGLFSMGQILCIAMILSGLILLSWVHKYGKSALPTDK